MGVEVIGRSSDLRALVWTAAQIAEIKVQTLVY